MEKGESPEEALAREFKEELAVEITVGARVAALKFSNGGEQYELYAYQVEIPVTSYLLTEHQQASWLTPEKLKSLPMASSDRALMERLLDNRS